jgi:trehalose 6-phosphate synthase
MGARIVIVSNRVAVPEKTRGAVAGGLAVAVKAAMKGKYGLWFGWSGKVADNLDAAPQVFEHKNVTYALIDLLEGDYQEYYNGFANRVLWPVLHYRVDLQEYSRADASAYMRVNRLFADKLSEFLHDDDIVWVHDYHLIPLGRELRARGHKNPMGFYLHIPCAPPDILRTLPIHAEILGSLSYYDLVGFQTDNDRDNMAQYLVSIGAREIRADVFEWEGRQFRFGVFPVAIETAIFHRLARNARRSSEVLRIEQSLGGLKLVLGIDRLDYSKGIPHRLRAFEAFLENYPEWRGRVVLLQISPKSREGIREYEDIEAEVTSLIGRVNGRFGDAVWTPIRYINRSYSRTALSGIYRLADVAFVTPLRDGMNLVAKEFLAAQDPDDPGVLVLSELAGAAAQLDLAVIVNPHEIEGVAAALKFALEMPLEQRRARHAPMIKYLMHNDIRRWADEFLTTLTSWTSRGDLLKSLRAFLSTVMLPAP